MDIWTRCVSKQGEAQRHVPKLKGAVRPRRQQSDSSFPNKGLQDRQSVKHEHHHSNSLSSGRHVTQLDEESEETHVDIDMGADALEETKNNTFYRTP